MGSIKLTVVLVYFLLKCSQSFYLAGTRRVCGFCLQSTKVAVVVPTPNEAEQRTAVLKVPQNVWKWPTKWPFSKDSFERVNVGDGEFENADGNVALDEIFSAFARTSLQKSDHFNSLVISIEGGTDTQDCLHFPLGSHLNVNKGLPHESCSFDQIIFRSGIEQIDQPLEFFQDMWRVLKPTGQCLVCFTSQCTGASLKPLKIWHKMSDEQKMWIVGSYLHYSAFEGWDCLEGYDLIGTTGEKSLEFVYTDFKNAGSPKIGNLPAFAVKASKSAFPPITPVTINDSDQTTTRTSEAILLRIVGLRHASIEDKRSLARRVAALIRNCTLEQQQQQQESELKKGREVGELVRVERILSRLDCAVPSIYSVLREVKETVVPTTVKSLLCTLLLLQWTGSAAQLSGLRGGLGLDPPVAAVGNADKTSAVDVHAGFWSRLREHTDTLSAKDKVYMLADLLPLFDDPNCAELLAVTIDALGEFQSVLEKRLATARAATIQSISADLLLSDFLPYLTGLLNPEHHLLLPSSAATAFATAPPSIHNLAAELKQRVVRVEPFWFKGSDASQLKWERINAHGVI